MQTSFTVTFGTPEAAARGHLSAEVDSRPDGLNGGRTSFAPGENAVFFVYASSNISYSNPVATAGSISRITTGSVIREVDLQFADSREANLPVPASALQSVMWIGNSLGSLTLTSETVVRASSKGVAIARVRLLTHPDAWRLSSPASVAGLSDFPVLIHIAGGLA